MYSELLKMFIFIYIFVLVKKITFHHFCELFMIGTIFICIEKWRFISSLSCRVTTTSLPGPNVNRHLSVKGTLMPRALNPMVTCKVSWSWPDQKTRPTSNAMHFTASKFHYTKISASLQKNDLILCWPYTKTRFRPNAVHYGDLHASKIVSQNGLKQW